MKAILKKGETSAYAYSKCGKQTTIDKNIQYDFKYDEDDNFYIVIDGVEYEEVSTAFDFVD